MNHLSANPTNAWPAILIAAQIGLKNVPEGSAETCANCPNEVKDNKFGCKGLCMIAAWRHMVPLVLDAHWRNHCTCNHFPRVKQKTMQHIYY
ncbi:MAG: hypothetical protein FWC61_00315 [Proteobacteria bacterium]|nr:hypothetical protein [Pseudomonadota bacterium]